MVLRKIGGKEYDMTFCKDCEVWILSRNFIKHKINGSCEKYAKGKIQRRNVNKKLCEMF